MSARNAAQFLRPSDLFNFLFERMPMGVAILDRQFRIQRYNPTWGEFAVRYAPLTGAPLAPGVGYFEHLPGSEPIVRPLFERVLAGETIQQNNICLQAGGTETYWNIVLAPLVENAEIMGILNVAVDITEQTLLRQSLEQRVEARTQELQVLLDVSATANRSINLAEGLQKTLDRIVSLVDASRAGVVLLDEQGDELLPYLIRPEQVIAPEDLAVMLAACRDVFERGKSLYVAPDIEQGLREPGALLPIRTRESRLGVLVIVGPEGGRFSEAQLSLFQSIADQLGIAIENARLFEQVKLSAVAAERSRLARDLHDAVTQTLFSASLIAEVLPRLWERNPAEGRRRLEELRQLTRGALSEMRTLLVELRPAALADTDLGDLIGHQVNALVARSRLTVQYERSALHNPPVEVKEAFYRIAQEAFNNIAKHAEASQVTVKLDCQPDWAELRIEDDGVGFDASLPAHEGLGLGIMRERARSVEAQLEISSQVRGGTRLRLTWQSPHQENQDD
jgi:signal transduction histidine kinase